MKRLNRLGDCLLSTLIFTCLALSGSAGLAGCGAQKAPGSPSSNDPPAKAKRLDLIDPKSFPPRLSLAEPAPGKLADHPGLQVRELVAGTGERVLHYGEIGSFHSIGSLAGGKVFHDTFKTGEADVIRLLPPGCPKGLALALDGIKKGGRRRVVIPAELGYGKDGDYTQGIPPDALLVYEIELVGFESGLRIGVMKAGTGETLHYGDTGQFHYTGVLAKDGTVFDTSRGAGASAGPTEPRTFALLRGSLIKGWVLGLPGMKVGEQRHLMIPSALAYGKQGSGEVIGPDADLIFEVELVGLVK